MTVADLIKKSGKNITGKVRVGMTSDIRTQKLGLARRVGGGGRLNFSCGDLACVCSGDDDCNDLFTSTNCGPIAVCYEDGCFCCGSDGWRSKNSRPECANVAETSVCAIGGVNLRGAY